MINYAVELTENKKRQKYQTFKNIFKQALSKTTLWISMNIKGSLIH